MGFAASQARLMMLTARKSDLELRLQFNNQARLRLANMMSGLMLTLSSQTTFENQAVTQRMQNVISYIQQQDKMLEMEARRIESQHEAVSTEIQAVRKVIQKNIASTFKIMG
ncbi:MAG: hypothetical protein KTR14_01905 [Vampirovibrio sp.]|nr:hypothetical protein [Vampirovibrio sp.]